MSVDNTIKESIPGPQLAMLWFFVITTLYVPIKYINWSVESEEKPTIVYFGIYVLMIIVGEYFINLGTTSAMCGSAQWNTAITVTIIPWVVIFGLLNVMLRIFPGWLTPFSNTIGYAVTKMMGVGDVFINILADPDGDSGLNDETKKALARIYSDSSLMINEIPANLSGFTTFWKRISPLMKKNEQFANNGNYQEEMIERLNYKVTPEGEDTKPQTLAYQLFNFIRLKNIISEWIWYMLTGALVTSVGYNYIVNAGCQLSVNEMQQRHDTFMDEEKELAKARGAKPERIYKQTD